MNRFCAIILFAASLRAEVVQLGTISQGVGISVDWPKDRPDIVSLELTFLKPGAGVTNLTTIQTTNHLLQIADMPAEIPDGRIIVALRWLCLGGVKSQYRMATMDLYRNAPEPPIVKPTFVSTDGNTIYQIETGTNVSLSVPNRPLTLEEMQLVKNFKGKINYPEQNYAAPDGTIYTRNENGKTNRWVRMSGQWCFIDENTNQVWTVQSNTIEDYRGKTAFTIDPELTKAIAEHFNRPTNPPPMPPSTNTNESATKRAMLEFYKHGPKR